MKNAKQILLETITLIDGAYAPSTVRAYKGNFEKFIKFCDDSISSALPAEPEQVKNYIEELSNSHLTSASIRIAIASISAIHRLNGRYDPTQDPKVKIEIKRMHRKLGRESKQAHAITLSMLHKLINVTKSNLKGLRDRALLLTAYDTMCRRSELVSLKIEDIDYSPNGLPCKIKLRKSKTDQHSSGKWLYLSNESIIAIKQWLSASKLISGYLFRGLNKKKEISDGLSSAQINRIYKNLARLANIPNHIVQNISGHSMRVGAAQDLLLGGASLPIIMSRGRWSKTDTIMRYVERVDYSTT